MDAENPMNWKKWLGIVGLLFAVLGAGVASYYSIVSARGRKQWDETQTELARRGLTTDFAKLVPPEIPDEENCFTPVLQKYLEEPGKDPTRKRWREITECAPSGSPDSLRKRSGVPGPPTDLLAWAEYLKIPDTKSLTEELAAEQILATLEPSNVALESLLGSLHLPSGRVPINYTHRPLVSLPLEGLNFLSNLSRIAQLRARVHLAAGATDLAAREIQVILRIAGMQQDVPAMLGGLAGGASMLQALDVLREGSALGKWNEAQLSQFIVLLERMDSVRRVRKTSEGELCYFMETLDDYLSGTRKERAEMVVGNIGNPRTAATLSLLSDAAPSGWWDESKAMAANFLLRELVDRLHPAATTGPRIDLPPEAEVYLASLPRSPGSVLPRLSIPSWVMVFERSVVLAAYERMAVVACGLERYKLANGRYPDALSELAPQFLETVPNDSLTGAPFPYRPVDYGKAFELYSIGGDGVDDGGRYAGEPGRPEVDVREGDIPWPRLLPSRVDGGEPLP